MSGVEIAGFVLAGFPLLISAAEHYREGFEPLLKWKRFRTDFISFIDAVDIEKQLYYQMLERFLLSADVPHEELQLFMTKPNYNGWQREDLVKVLKGRLGPSYEVYVSTFKTMNQLMGGLQDVLSLKNGEVDWADDGASRWDYQLKRVRLSFSKKGPKTLSLLESHNRKLRELLESNDQLESMKATKKDTSWGGIFECIRQHASSLHSAIKRNWRCNCTTPHITDLQLQRRSTGGWSSSFNIAFEALDETELRNIRRREVVIRIRKESRAEEPPYAPSLPSKGQFSAQEQYLDMGRLRRNFEPNSTPQVNIMPRPSLSPALSETSTIPSHGALKEKFTSRERYADNLPNTCGRGVRRADGRSSRMWFPGRKGKPKKSVRMDLPPPLELPIRLAPDPTPTPVQLEARQVSNVQRVEIKDLCSRIQAFDACSNYLGYLTDEEQRHHELQWAQKIHAASTPNSYISLETLLTNEDVTSFTRQQRYKIACTLASSLLQLQTTPWFTEKIEKKNVLFYKEDSKIFFDYPFVRHSFPSVKSYQNPTGFTDKPPATRFVTRNSISNLGIILLELCFGQAIEQQKFRKAYLGPDGKPHEWTDYMTSRDWVEIVAEEDPALEPIIKCCVFCTFEEKADWENKKFTQAVYVNVVEPLEKIITKWSGS